MKVSVRSLNKGETFCCSVKCAKSIFQSTDVHLNFSFFGRDYSVLKESSRGYFLKNKIKGRVVASMTVYNVTSEAMLSFYVLKESQYPLEMKEIFENTYLPKFLEFYKVQIKNTDLICNEKTMIIELCNDEFKIHIKQFA